MDPSGILYAGVIILVAFSVALCQVMKSVRTETRLGGHTQMFCLGILLSLSYLLIFYLRHQTWTPTVIQEELLYLLRGGVSSLLIYELIRRAAYQLSVLRLTFLTALVWYMHGIVNIGLHLLFGLISGSVTPRTYSYYSTPTHWLKPSLAANDLVFALTSAAIIVAVTYYLNRRSVAITPSWPTIGSFYGGSAMSSDETTRLLSASAFLSGQQFRKKVLDHFEDNSRACAPEIGLDAPLVAQMCKYAENRDSRYLWLFFLIAVIAASVALAVDTTLGIVVGVLAAAALYTQKATQERSFVRRYFRRDNFNAADVRKRFPAALDHGALAGAPPGDQNLVVYRGFTPFIGAGINLGGWSFTVDIDKASESDLVAQPKEPIPFAIEDLYGAIEDKIGGLRLDRLRIEDYCFVNGSEIREDRKILPDMFRHPVQKLSKPDTDAFKKVSDARIRHYQWIRVHDWGNELVMSYFFRCALRGTTLFIEINRFLLTPVFWKYRQADRLPESQLAEQITQMFASVFVGPIMVAISPLLIFARFNHALENLFNTKERKRRNEIKNNPLYDYGALTSLRYQFSSDSFSHYFQKLDGDFYTKVLEHQILDGLVDFLEDHNIDTSEIRERRTTILNSGVIVQGGDVKAESLAVGAGAIAVKTQPAASKKAPAAKEAAA
jgi:hypothetical protein